LTLAGCPLGGGAIGAVILGPTIGGAQTGTNATGGSSNEDATHEASEPPEQEAGELARPRLLRLSSWHPSLAVGSEELLASMMKVVGVWRLPAEVRTSRGIDSSLRPARSLRRRPPELMEPTPFHVAIATDTPDATRAAVEMLLDVELFEVPDNARASQSYDDVGRPVPRPRAWHGGRGPLHVEVLSGEPGTVYGLRPGTYLHHLAHWTDDLRADVWNLDHEGWHLECSGRDEEGRPSRWAYLSHPDRTRLELVDSSRRDWYLAFVKPRGGARRP
jgi:glyoxalase/bleomycin resistance protein/dioxygenase superfamily protein